MIYRPPYPSEAYRDDDWLTEGVLSRRVFAWLIDMLLIGLIVGALWFVLLLFGLLTLGFGFSLFAVLPFVPFAYHFAVGRRFVRHTRPAGARPCGAPE